MMIKLRLHILYLKYRFYMRIDWLWRFTRANQLQAPKQTALNNDNDTWCLEPRLCFGKLNLPLTMGLEQLKVCRENILCSISGLKDLSMHLLSCHQVCSQNYARKSASIFLVNGKLLFLVLQFLRCETERILFAKTKE